MRRVSWYFFVLLNSFGVASSALAQSAVATQVEFGQYINCWVQNNLNLPIRIRQINYQVNGNFGPAWSSITCVKNCNLAPGYVNKFTGPHNDPNISAASCEVNFDIVYPRYR